MDVQMPVMNGIEATREIVALGRHDSSRVLILTTFDLDEYVYEGLRAGASGFLLKRTPAEDLVTAVRVVAGGDALIDPGVTRRLIEHFRERDYQRASRELSAPEGLSELTEREREVLLLVGRGLSNHEIAEQLFLSEGTVKTHVKHVFAKLGLRDRAQAVILSYESGIIEPGSSGQGV
jgi:DNA-binding NarL/FixJ family response regulator